MSHRRAIAAGRAASACGGADRFSGWGAAEGGFGEEDGKSARSGRAERFSGWGAAEGGFGGADGFSCFGGGEDRFSGWASAEGGFGGADGLSSWAVMQPVSGVVVRWQVVSAGRRASLPSVVVRTVSAAGAGDGGLPRGGCSGFLAQRGRKFPEVQLPGVGGALTRVLVGAWLVGHPHIRPHVHHQVPEVQLAVDEHVFAFEAAGEDPRVDDRPRRPALFDRRLFDDFGAGRPCGGAATVPTSLPVESFDACKSAITSVIEAGRSSGFLAIIFW